MILEALFICIEVAWIDRKKKTKNKTWKKILGNVKKKKKKKDENHSHQ